MGQGPVSVCKRSLLGSVCVCVCVWCVGVWCDGVADTLPQGELKGKRGLVPSNFLEECEERESERGQVTGSGSRRSTGGLGMEIFAASEQDLEHAKRIIEEVGLS